MSETYHGAQTAISKGSLNSENIRRSDSKIAVRLNALETTLREWTEEAERSAQHIKTCYDERRREIIISSFISLVFGMIILFIMPLKPALWLLVLSIIASVAYVSYSTDRIYKSGLRRYENTQRQKFQVLKEYISIGNSLNGFWDIEISFPEWVKFLKLMVLGDAGRNNPNYNYTWEILVKRIESEKSKKHIVAGGLLVAAADIKQCCPTDHEVEYLFRTTREALYARI